MKVRVLIATGDKKVGDIINIVGVGLENALANGVVEEVKEETPEKTPAVKKKAVEEETPTEVKPAEDVVSEA